MVEHRSPKPRAAGSSPVSPANENKESQGFAVPLIFVSVRRNNDLATIWLLRLQKVTGYFCTRSWR